MALPPTIPTSFVPHPASSASRRFHMDFVGAFSFVCYVILIGVIVLSISVFLYSRILTSALEKKEADLAKARAAIDATTAQSFVRLHDRLASGKSLLGNHTALSGFFSVIEEILPSTVRFNTMHLSFGEMGAATVDGTGIAKNFNALAAASASLAADGEIKDAIFSHISINKDGSVTFSLSALLEQKLVTFSAPAPVAAPVATTTATTTRTTASSTSNL